MTAPVPGAFTAANLHAARSVVLAAIVGGQPAAVAELAALPPGDRLDVAGILAILACHGTVLLTADEYELLVAGWQQRLDAIERRLDP